jgi:hypothetical protein
MGDVPIQPIVVEVFVYKATACQSLTNALWMQIAKFYLFPALVVYKALAKHLFLNVKMIQIVVDRVVSLGFVCLYLELSV